MGRPKGSKNKPKNIDPSALPPAEVPKKRGRPPGSKNKPKDNSASATPATTEAPRRRGRPPGSKNKARGSEPFAVRSPKVVAPTPPPTVSTPPPMPAAASAVVVTRTEDEPKDAEPTEVQVAPYTLEQLNNPALDELEKHASVFYANASPKRKLMFEGRATDSLTVQRAVLRTLIDFFEIDVTQVIKSNGKTATEAPSAT